VSHPPDHLRDLDRLLQSVHFEPRPSLGAELRGRWQRGEVAPAGRAPRPGLRVAAAVMLVGLGLLVFWLLALSPFQRLTVDRCCQDLDGGGQADDGLLVVTRRGHAVQQLQIYEDRDRSGSFTAADTVLFQRRGQPALSDRLGEGERTIEFCCLDYDGDGPSDDGLLIIGRPPDHITLAAIYEAATPSGHPAPLR
jgi:hypothetical protein